MIVYMFIYWDKVNKLFNLFEAWNPVSSDEDEVVIEEADEYLKVEDDIGKTAEGSRTDDEVVAR